jgi:FlaA1/EpsC-like NDP-sugar epimerase
LKDQVLEHRRALIVALQAALVLSASYLAFWFRFDGEIPERYVQLYLWTAPVVALRGVVFVPVRLYEGFWRYTSIDDLGRIIAGVATSSLLVVLVLRVLLGLEEYPRSVLLLDPILLVGLLAGSRIAGRFLRQFRRVPHERRVLIYGAGDAAEMIVRDMRNNAFYAHQPIGFIDDDPKKAGARIRGIRVLGTAAALPEVMEREKPDDILIAMPSAEPAVIRRIVRELEPYKVPILTLPNVRDLLAGKVSVSEVRRLSYEDLLPRAPVDLSVEPARAIVEGRRILVTGAGGSIGSELCRQIARQRPAELLLLDFAETPLHAIDQEMRAIGGAVAHRAILADVRHRERVGEVFRELRPDVVFHAAAYKHVPLVESSPVDAVLNNVIGTRNVADAAVRERVEHFVFVSTDKAVNPTSVMGATKRVCELYVRALAASGTADGTIACSVRFGNVLGSNGSVVPLFLKQIERGGPVTVTHDAITRYFMTIPEAVQLVLHAAAFARGGDTFVLDMGEQISILELARSLIRLAGYVPEEEIAIEITGLRPGEKLFEELIADGETTEPTGHEKLARLRSSTDVDARVLLAQIDELDRIARTGSGGAEVRRLLDSIVATSTPLPRRGLAAHTLEAARAVVSG